MNRQLVLCIKTENKLVMKPLQSETLKAMLPFTLSGIDAYTRLFIYKINLILWNMWDELNDNHTE